MVEVGAAALPQWLVEYFICEDVPGYLFEMCGSEGFRTLRGLTRYFLRGLSLRVSVMMAVP